MAQAGTKPITPPRGFPLTVYFNQRRTRGATRREALAYATDLLRSDDVAIYPQLPPVWHLELGPRDELLIVTADGARHDCRGLYVEHLNVLTPVTRLPHAALEATTSCPEPPPSPPAVAVLTVTQVWFDQALKEHPQMQNEAKDVYARRLTDLMRKAAVNRQWKWTTTRRRLDDEQAKPGKPTRQNQARFR